ncbi:helix-turn-helix domain-containing protein [Glycocaulis sp.]|uniref:helix-turn-helix domain-containing protein n=1 Tax=Glycocaulis sp. TaxID=1969725 RepID=UPI003D19A250
MAEKLGPRSPNPIDRHVGIRIRLRRRVIQMSQQALAAKLGVTFQQLQKYENGTNRIGAGRLYELARALGVPVGYFYEDFDQAVDPTQRTKEELEAISAFIGSREGVELAQSFNRIDDPKVRRHILQLAGALGTKPSEDI